MPRKILTRSESPIPRMASSQAHTLLPRRPRYLPSHSLSTLLPASFFSSRMISHPSFSTSLSTAAPRHRSCHIPKFLSYTRKRLPTLLHMRRARGLIPECRFACDPAGRRPAPRDCRSTVPWPPVRCCLLYASAFTRQRARVSNVRSRALPLDSLSLPLSLSLSLLTLFSRYLPAAGSMTVSSFTLSPRSRHW